MLAFTVEELKLCNSVPLDRAAGIRLAAEELIIILAAILSRIKKVDKTLIRH